MTRRLRCLLSLVLVAIATALVTVARPLAAGAAPVAAAATPAVAGTPEPITPVVQNLEFPTNLAQAPDGRIFFSEKETGRIRIVTPGGGLLDRPFARLPVVGGAERGLLGLALRNDFRDEPWVYAYMSDARDGMNRIVRLRADGDRATTIRPVFTGLPSASGYHNGGDLAFGTDGMLYASLGEAHDPQRAQDPNDLGGKIVRLAPDGSIPPDNPFGPASPVYALGIRNSFGLCVDPLTGTLWETENGPDRDDEINRIDPGANYGWPERLGPGGGANFVDPQLVYPRVIVPTGCTVANGDLYFGEYTSGRLHRARLSRDGQRVLDDQIVGVAPGPIVDVITANDGSLLVATTDAIVRVDITLGGASREPTGAPSPETTPLPDRAAGDGESPAGGGAALAWLAGGAALALLLAVPLVVRARRRRRAARSSDA